MNSADLSQSTVTPELWMVYAVALMTIVYAVFIRPRRQKDPLAKPLGQSRSGLARQRDVEKQMETLLVELSAMARQITAQLDTRTAKLELLIQEADEKIAALGNARANSTNSANPLDPATPAAAGRDMLAAADDPRHSAVYKLADAGLTASQIAQKLAKPNGEVELILALRPRK